MTEAEWLKCADVLDLLRYVNSRRRKPSDKILGRFACACCRSVLHLISVEDCRQGVETVERYWDGSATYEACYAAGRSVAHASMAQGWLVGRDYLYNTSDPANLAANACWAAVRLLPAEEVAAYAQKAVACEFSNSEAPGREGWWYEVMLAGVCEGGPQAAILRDVLGNPFRPVPIARRWLAPPVVSLVAAAYAERELPSGLLNRDRLAILADALEEAGCADADVIGHLRGPGPHVRGCWVVDLLLGKK